MPYNSVGALFKSNAFSGVTRPERALVSVEVKKALRMGEEVMVIPIVRYLKMQLQERLTQSE